MSLDQPDDRSVAAGEYVLGTLQAQERAAFDSLLAGDPALQAEVYAWQDRLVGLTQRVDAVEPDPRTRSGPSCIMRTSAQGESGSRRGYWRPARAPIRGSRSARTMFASRARCYRSTPT